ncbi:hypothetical protein AAFF_G00144050 [Aldrovandia affinis]|uniref:G-protein coupled receptors family 1 profile domain-containing protein n=1 Tax=Aldrovandia affinis TaxID=143900 RepID=A0AAD7WX29_9TELE|nr:hypothetical protein AAFF_G00144050 [Aldrovandia affinis]
MNLSVVNSTERNISYTQWLCFSINYINGTLVHTFLRHEIFNGNPRYILFVHMVINDMIQLTIAVLLNLTAYIFFKINVSFCCFLLVIAISTTVNTPLNVASMAIERYIAICEPLRHTQICTVRRTYNLIGIIWTLGALPILADVFMLLATEPKEFFRSSIFCSQDMVFRQAVMLKKKNICHAIYLSFVWLILVYTYFRILFAATTMSADASKARNTILLHAAQLLMCMLTYVGPVLNAALLYMFPMNLLEIRFTSYVIIHILPRLGSPIIYGLRDEAFRKYFKLYLLCNVTVTSHHKNMSTIRCVTSPRVKPSL